MHQVGVTLKTMLGSVMAGTGATFAQVDFKGTITLGSILIGVFIAVIAAFFTIRSRIASVWREESEGWRQKAERQAAELQEQIRDRADYERQQQELRHALKDELATCKAQLKVESAKHDLTVIIERMQAFHTEAMAAMAAAQTDAVGSVTTALHEFAQKLEGGQLEQKLLLREIRDTLNKERP